MPTATAAVIVSIGALSVSVMVAVYQRISGNSTSWWNRLMDAVSLTGSDNEIHRTMGWTLLEMLSESGLRSREDKRIALKLWLKLGWSTPGHGATSAEEVPVTSRLRNKEE